MSFPSVPDPKADANLFTPERGAPFNLSWGEEIEVLESAGGRIRPTRR